MELKASCRWLTSGIRSSIPWFPMMPGGREARVLFRALQTQKRTRMEEHEDEPRPPGGPMLQREGERERA